MTSDFEFQNPPTPRRRGSKASTPVPSQAVAKKPFGPDTTTELGNHADDVPVDTPTKGKTKPKYDPDELAVIFDEIIFSGEYTEQAVIKGKLTVVFRTRTAEEIREINRIVDGTQAVYSTTLDSVRSLLQLQYALVMYQGKDLRGMQQEERAKFLGRVPGPVVGALLMALNRFDNKVFAACQEGEENF